MTKHSSVEKYQNILHHYLEEYHLDVLRKNLKCHNSLRIYHLQRGDYCAFFYM
jgi:hypothetical protein